MMQANVSEENINLVGSTKFGRYPFISTEETFNFIISDECLVPSRGHNKLLQLNPNATESRAIFRSTTYDHVIVVVNHKVYAVSENFQYSIVGILETSSGFVSIAENLSQQIAIADGAKIYVYNWFTQDFSTVDPGFLPIYLNSIDNYMIAAARDDTRWYLSDLGNALVWPNDANTVGRVQNEADHVQAIGKVGSQIYTIGEVHTQLWTDVGSSPFPFLSSKSVTIPYGTQAVGSIAMGFERIVWLASNATSAPTLIVSFGGKEKEILGDGLEFQLDNLTNINDAVGFLYEEYGHIIYQITFRSDNLTIAYDFMTKQIFTFTDENLNFHIAKQSVFFNNKNIFISLIDGFIYEASAEITTYSGKIIPRIRKPNNFRLSSYKSFMVHNIQVVMAQGQNKVGGRLLLSISRDGGHSYGTVVGKDLKSLGNRINRMAFYALGSANDIVYQFRWETPGSVIAKHAVMFYEESL